MVILTTDNRVLHVSRASRVSLLGNLPEGIYYGHKADRIRDSDLFS